MSYENAVPKPLKFLISDGKMIDDAGNVIAESETLKDLYTKWNPEVKKYLLSDGSVIDENNNLIIKNDYYKKIYDQADPKVAKYLHSDGTVDENPGGGSADLEDNHQTTIDVSTYTQPVEILPTSGKDGMKKATITLSNIPSPSGGGTAYAWKEKTTNEVLYTNFSVAPQSIYASETNYKVLFNRDGSLVYDTLVSWGDIGAGYGYFTANDDWGIEDSETLETESEYERYAESDIASFW